MAALQWESIKQNEGGIGPIRRAQVPGGWLLSQSTRDHPPSLLFIPDPGPAWEVEVEAENAMPAGRGWDRR